MDPIFSWRRGGGLGQPSIRKALKSSDLALYTKQLACDVGFGEGSRKHFSSTSWKRASIGFAYEAGLSEEAVRRRGNHKSDAYRAYLSAASSTEEHAPYGLSTANVKRQISLLEVTQQAERRAQEARPNQSRAGGGAHTRQTTAGGRSITWSPARTGSGAEGRR